VFDGHSMVCGGLADQACALAGHEVRTKVTCGKHYLEVPCTECSNSAQKNTTVNSVQGTTGGKKEGNGGEKDA